MPMVAFRYVTNKSDLAILIFGFRSKKDRMKIHIPLNPRTLKMMPKMLCGGHEKKKGILEKCSLNEHPG